MAPAKRDNPEVEMQTLHERRVELATKRHANDAAAAAAETVINGAQERRRAVLLAEARGDKPGETVERVDQDRRQAELKLSDCRERSDALRVVEAEIGEAVNDVVDRNPGHYLRKRVEAIEEAERLTRAADDAVRAATAGYMAAGAASNIVWHSYKRRELDGGPREWPANDLGGASSEIAKALGLLALLKGRSEAQPEETRPRASLSVPEARAQLQGPASEPLLETI